MISERAFVSQGTFFNYFRTKDAAIVGIGGYDLDAGLVRAAYDRIEARRYHATLTLFLKVVRDRSTGKAISRPCGRGSWPDAVTHEAVLGQRVRLRSDFAVFWTPI